MGNRILVNKRLRNLTTTNSGVFYLLLDVPLHAINYLFLVVLSAYLLPEEYGRATALVSITTILITPGSAVQLAMGRLVAQHQTPQIGLAKSTKNAMLISLLVLTFSSPILSVLLRTQLVAMILVVFAVSSHMYLSIWRGRLQGTGSFLRLSSSMYSEIVIKFGCAIILFRLFDVPETVIICLVIAYLVAIAWTNRISSPRTDIIQQTLPFNTILPFIIQLGFIQITMNIDLLIMNRWNPDLSGYYATTIRFGQLIAYAMLSLQVVLIPYLAQHRKQMPIVWIGLGYGLFSAIVIFSYWTIVPLSIPYLFGSEYLQIKPELPWVAASYLLYALMNMLILLFMMENIRLYQHVMLSVMIALIIGYSTAVGEIAHMLRIQLIVYSMACVVLFFLYARNTKRGKFDE